MARFLRTFSTALCAMASVWVAGSVPAHAQVPTYLTQWGTYGSGDGQFQLPSGIATDGVRDLDLVHPLALTTLP